MIYVHRRTKELFREKPNQTDCIINSITLPGPNLNLSCFKHLSLHSQLSPEDKTPRHQ